MVAGGEQRGSILSEIHLGLFVPLFLHTMLIHIAIVLARVSTSYAAIDLGLSFLWVGIISSGFSILPVFLAVPLGRIIDRGHDAVAVRAGSVCLIFSALAFWLPAPSALSLFLATVLLGTGQIACMAGAQMISIRAGKTTRGRDAVFGYHMVAIAMGQGVGPLIIGWFAGDARVPPTGLVFGVLVIITLLALGSSYALPKVAKGPEKARTEAPARLRDLLRIRGLLAYVTASIMTVTALDLIVVYLPLLGAERQIDAATIGMIMSARAVSSMMARFLYVPLVELLGRMPLTYLTMLSPAVAFIVVAIPVPLWLVFPAMIIAGMGLGVSATLTLSGTVDLAPHNARATAMSLRLTGNRLGQIVIPMAASLVATAAGAGGVFLILAVTLSGSAAYVWTSRRGI